MANRGCKLATMAACAAPAWAWAGGDLSPSLGVADAFAALCYLGAPTLIALAVAKGGRAKQTQDPSERRRDLREMAACAVAGLALLAMPSAMLDSTVGLGAPSALQAREGGQARDQAPAVGGSG